MEKSLRINNFRWICPLNLKKHSIKRIGIIRIAGSEKNKSLTVCFKHILQKVALQKKPSIEGLRF